MEAGVGRKLIKVTYHGATRIMEPYSLVFKRRKDGVAEEYFYAWDRTGGNSGPGIKTLFHYDNQGLAVLGETFEPRFGVTLSKAGDSSQRGYFAGNGRPRAPASRMAGRRPRTHTGPPYASGTALAHTRWKLLRYSAVISPPPMSRRRNTGACAAGTP